MSFGRMGKNAQKDVSSVRLAFSDRGFLLANTLWN